MKPQVDESNCTENQWKHYNWKYLLISELQSVKKSQSFFSPYLPSKFLFLCIYEGSQPSNVCRTVDEKCLLLSSYFFLLMTYLSSLMIDCFTAQTHLPWPWTKKEGKKERKGNFWPSKKERYCTYTHGPIYIHTYGVIQSYLLCIRTLDGKKW